MPRLSKDKIELLHADIIRGDTEDSILAARYGVTTQAISQHRTKLQSTRPIPLNISPELKALMDDVTEKKKTVDTLIAACKALIKGPIDGLSKGVMPSDDEREQLEDTMERLVDFCSKSVGMTQMVLNAATAKNGTNVNVQVNTQIINMETVLKEMLEWLKSNYPEAWRAFAKYKTERLESLVTQTISVNSQGT